MNFTASRAEITRQQAEAPAPRPEPEAQTTAGTDKPVIAALVRMRAPGEVSTVHGSSGTLYMAAADGSFAMTPDDAEALFGHGFVVIEEDRNE